MWWYNNAVEHCGNRLFLLHCHVNVETTQGPLITEGRNSCEWTGPTVGLSKSFIRVKISVQTFFKITF